MKKNYFLRFLAAVLIAVLIGYFYFNDARNNNRTEFEAIKTPLQSTNPQIASAALTHNLLKKESTNSAPLSAKEETNQKHKNQTRKVRAVCNLGIQNERFNVRHYTTDNLPEIPKIHEKGVEFLKANLEKMKPWISTCDEWINTTDNELTQQASYSGLLLSDVKQLEDTMKRCYDLKFAYHVWSLRNTENYKLPNILQSIVDRKSKDEIKTLTSEGEQPEIEDYIAALQRHYYPFFQAVGESGINLNRSFLGKNLYQHLTKSYLGKSKKAKHKFRNMMKVLKKYQVDPNLIYGSVQDPLINLLDSGPPLMKISYFIKNGAIVLQDHVNHAPLNLNNYLSPLTCPE